MNEIWLNPPVTSYMYFANSTGLVQYNGLSSTTYTLPGQQGIRSVYADNKGNIYTGLYEDFGVWKNDGKGGLYIHQNDDCELPNKTIYWLVISFSQICQPMGSQ